MQEFIDIIEQLIQLFKDLIPIEEKKREAAQVNNISHVEECMVKEQSAILKLRGLEQERERILKDMGIAGVAFREMIEQCPEHAERLQPLFSELAIQIQIFREISEGADVVIRTNLNQIENTIKMKESGIYSESGEPITPEKHFTNCKV